MSETNPPEEPQVQGMSAEEAIAERERLIERMEKDLARPRVGVLPPVAAIAFCGAVFLAAQQWHDVSYYFSSREPIELGAEGDYHPERGVSNRYAQLRGVPTVRGWYVDEKDGSFVVVGVSDTPFLVKRVTFPEEARRGLDGKRPQPRQNTFFARGRLLSRADAGVYAELFSEYQAWSGVEASWLLIAEQPPGKDFSTVSMFGFFVLFAALNAWLFVRGVKR